MIYFNKLIKYIIFASEAENCPFDSRVEIMEAKDIATNQAHPEILVTTEWVAANLNNPKVRILESNEDPLLYRSGHIQNALEVDWVRDLNDQLVRDYLSDADFSALMSRLGITPETTVVFYGDKSNWWATYSLWVFTLFGHTRCKIMDGGRLKWEKEGRALTKDVPAVVATQYPKVTRDDVTYRAFRNDVLAHVKSKGKIIDVRSPDEYTGKRLHMEGYPNEGALRGGHIPGAKSVPWAKAVNPEDGTFKSPAALRALYEGEAGMRPDDSIVVYCRIGERSSHTWFVLRHLLGYPKVRNYDGSWTEWGNSVGVPVEK
jgi:thiosulfate/3-mercaptopyruvate sulfurtransferase